MAQVDILSPAQQEAQAREADIEKKLNNFKDVDGVSTRSLSFGLWYMGHRHLFFLIAVWFFSIVATILWVYSLYFFGYYILVGMKNDRLNNNISTENPIVAEQRSLLTNVNYNFVTAVDLGRNSYSLVGELTNSNAGNWAIFDYYFLIGDNNYGAGTGYIMPGEKKFIAGVTSDLTVSTSEVKLIVTNFRWSKLDRHVITDWSAYKLDHLNFVVLDKKFISAVESSLSDRLPINTLSFNIANRTAFNYAEAPLQILLYSGSDMVYAENYIINNFYSKDKKDIKLNIIGNLPNINRIEILPNINILDQSVYLAN